MGSVGARSLLISTEYLNRIQKRVGNEFSITVFNVHRLFAVCMLLAAKFSEVRCTILCRMLFILIVRMLCFLLNKYIWIGLYYCQLLLGWGCWNQYGRTQQHWRRILYSLWLWLLYLWCFAGIIVWQVHFSSLAYLCILQWNLFTIRHMKSPSNLSLLLFN